MEYEENISSNNNNMKLRRREEIRNMRNHCVDSEIE